MSGFIQELSCKQADNCLNSSKPNNYVLTANQANYQDPHAYNPLSGESGKEGEELTTDSTTSFGIPGETICGHNDFGRASFHPYVSEELSDIELGSKPRPRNQFRDTDVSTT